MIIVGPDWPFQSLADYGEHHIKETQQLIAEPQEELLCLLVVFSRRVQEERTRGHSGQPHLRYPDPQLVERQRIGFH
ncbi:MAG: hypothetical protein M1118_00545 [Chloroflexi bacterium]|nr:hypothetical protein [Chloroflexota bacterium]